MHKYEKIFLIIPIITMIVVLISIFTYGMATVHSDNAVELTALQSILASKKLFPQSWVYGNGDINIMRIQVFLFLPFLIFKDWIVARQVGNVLVVLFCSFGIIALSKKIFKDNSWIIAIPFIFLFFSGRALDVMLYSTMYTSTIAYDCLFFIWILALYNSEKKVSKIHWIGAAFLAFVMAGGTRWAAEITIPLFITVCACTYFAENIDKGLLNKTIYAVIWLLIPSAMGLGIYKYIERHRMFSNAFESSIYLVGSLEKIGKSLLETIGSFYRCFGYTGNVSIVSLLGIKSLVSITFCTIVCFVIPVLQILKWKDEQKDVRAFLTYGYVHNVILFVVCVITAKASAVVAYRVLPILFIFLIISARYIWVYWLNGKKSVSILWTFLIIFAVLVESVALIKGGLRWKELYNSHAKVIEILKEEGLTKGYGSFWNTYMYEAYSSGDIKFGGIDIEDNHIYRKKVLVDLRAYEPENELSFIIYTDGEADNLSTYEAVLGKAVKVIDIDDVKVYYHSDSSWTNTNLHLLVYDYDVAVKFEDQK